MYGARTVSCPVNDKRKGKRRRIAVTLKVTGGGVGSTYDGVEWELVSGVYLSGLSTSELNPGFVQKKSLLCDTTRHMSSLF